MFVEQKPESKKLYQKPLFYSALAIFLGFVYLGYVFLARWQSDREFERRAAQKAEQQRLEDLRRIELLGGNRFEILNFYASPGEIKRGENVQLCYGVSNAKTLKLEPAEGSVWPSLAHCIYVTPKRDTTYTLTAEDAEGHSKTATVAVQVK